MHNLVLNRLFSGDDWTIGVLELDLQPECFVLEDGHRTVKIAGSTRIPAGQYELKLRKRGESPKYDEAFKSNKLFNGMFEIIGVPGFSAILIHPGNTVIDTRGCLLVGRIANMDAAPAIVGASRTAFWLLYAKLLNWFTTNPKEKVTITIVDRDRHLFSSGLTS